WYFLSMEHVPANADDEEDAASDEQPPVYVWGRIDNNGRRAIVWWPDLEQFREAVRNGRIPGRINEDEDVVLGELNAEQMEVINSPSGNLMNWTEPLVLVRIGG
ncbi:MAG TPA: hypothetical protein VKN35_02940, partial [Xanthomonadales bacterium]|nr:hypothetical protein [Xanthomonadales bacterium]